MDSSDGFVPIVAMFYAVFHPTQGTKVVHQVPSGSISRPERTNSATLAQPLFDFDSIKNYVIPKPNLCNRLITFKIANYRVVGFPVNIYSSNYARNSFSYNFCFVFPYDSDTTAFEDQIRRIAKMFRALEEQSQVLSSSEKDSHVFFKEDHGDLVDGKGSGQRKQSTSNIDDNYLKIINDLDTSNNQPLLPVKQFNTPGQTASGKEGITSIESLVQQIFQDLNNYSECLIPIDNANSIDIKLFPIIPPPVEISACDVPITTLKLDTMVDVLWDPTMVKILPFINGINSIDKIAKLSNSDYELAKQCIQHLLHYKAVTMLDIFQFSNSYAPTDQIGNFLKDPLMAYECQAYVACDNQFNDLPLRAPRSSNTNLESMNKNNKKQEDEEYDIDDASKRKNTSFRPSQISQNNSFIDRKKDKLDNSAGPSSSVQSVSPKANAISKKPVKVISLPSKANLFYLYRSLHQNLSIKHWYMEHSKLLANVDIRRFISFGVLRGLIYRVRAYPISTRLETSSSLLDNFRESSGTFAIKMTEKKKRSPTFVRGSGLMAPFIPEGDDQVVDIKDVKEERQRQKDEQQLLKLLKKFNDFDLICTEMNKSRAQVEEMLNGLGEWSIINA